MSKFENLLNTLWEDYPQSNTSPAPSTNNNLTNTPSGTSPAPTQPGVNPAIGTPSNQQQPKPSTSQQSPKPGTPKPGTTNQPIVDPSHNAIKTIAGITDPNKLAQYLKDPKNGVQLVSTTNK